MENINYSPKAAREIAASGLLAAKPFVLLDVGCSGGIEPYWRNFEPDFQAHGLDPSESECARLRQAEQNPNVFYYAQPAGLPPSHEFVQRRAANEAGIRVRYDQSIITRSSMWRERGEGGPGSAMPPAVALSDFLAARSIQYVDFVKIDTDGSDLESLVSLDPALPAIGTLGFMVECSFQGSWHSTSNTFPNIDRFMKQRGYMLFDLEFGRYSRSALPAPYVYNMLAQTRSGQPLQGDVLFLRDLSFPIESVAAADALPLPQLLKLIGLYDLFNLPDCAAELILQQRDRLTGVIDPDRLLDLLTPPLDGRTVTYRQYSDYYRDHHEALFPGKVETGQSQ